MKITTEATSTEESQKPKSTRKPLYDTTLLQVTSPRNGTRNAHPPSAEDLAPKASIPSSRTSLIPTVFHEDWWMEAATEGRHTILEISANNQTVGRLPFMMRNRLGLKGIWTPPFTYFLGPGIDEEKAVQTHAIFADWKLPESSSTSYHPHPGNASAVMGEHPTSFPFRNKRFAPMCNLPMR